ncbi:MAG: Fe-S cluster assembly protein HesB [Candidatus Parabeggiatoa sp.]|nr:Fe-S cluster assembly protein HesB [Candidatus Parabeggiatoa sp.]
MPIFQVTENAATQILKAAEQGEMTELALRLAPHCLADGSIEYNKMGFDKIRDDDLLIHTEGVDIVFKAVYKELLEGAIMDFVEIEEGNPSFIFINPNDPNYVPQKSNKSQTPPTDLSQTGV